MDFKSKLLVLDLDSTLIHSEYLTAQNLDTKLETFIIKDEEVSLYQVKKRPFLGKFIQEANKYFALGVWTASNETYADAVIANLFNGIDLAVRYSREKCVIEYHPQTTMIKKIKKPLSKITSENKNFHEKNTLFIDDNPTTYEDNSANAIGVSPWTGQEDDYLLKQLIDIIKVASQLEDVRKIGVAMKKWTAAVN